MTKTPKGEGVAVILGTPVRGTPSSEPFAHVVSLDEGEVVASKTRTCLHVFVCADGAFEFADGLLAIRDKCILLNGSGEREHTPIHWKELGTALRLPVKTFEGFMNVKPDQPPYLRLKIYHEDKFAFGPTPAGDEGWGLQMLSILEIWNRWVADQATWHERVQEFKGASRWGQASLNIRDAWREAFRKFCGRVGLKPQQEIEFETPMNLLRSRLEDALHVWREYCRQI